MKDVRRMGGVWSEAWRRAIRTYGERRSVNEISGGCVFIILISSALAISEKIILKTVDKLDRDMTIWLLNENSCNPVYDRGLALRVFLETHRVILVRSSASPIS